MKHISLKPYYDCNNATIEIGIDEVGRGPMIGRVYAAAVILPKDDSFEHSLMKDSKRFTSEKKIKIVAEYIKQNAIAYGIGFADEKEIDLINIRNATHNAMHRAIQNIIITSDIDMTQCHLLVDGNDFKPYTFYKEDVGIIQIQSTSIVNGDNTYTSIAAASIIAKVERDNYIRDLCVQFPDLDTKYDILKNKGYGTKKHLDGIIKYGITSMHRTSFGICKTFIIDFEKSRAKLLL